MPWDPLQGECTRELRNPPPAARRLPRWWRRHEWQQQVHRRPRAIYDAAVTALAMRWPDLAGLPRIPLIATPTPVERLIRTSQETATDIWCKRDDRLTIAYGGSKARKLEYLFGEAKARGADVLVTTGAHGSHHVLAAAVQGRALGFDVHAVVVPQPRTDHVEQNARASLAAGAVLQPVPGYATVAPAMVAAMIRLRLRGRRPYLIMPGGSCAVGTVGFVAAGVELADQLDHGLLPEPEAIFVPLGSGGIAVGVCLGLAAAGLAVRVVAVRVSPRVFVTKPMLRDLARRTLRRLRRQDHRFPNVLDQAMAHLMLEHDFYGDGYGYPTAEGERAIDRAGHDGIELESTYGGKAFAGLLRQAEAGTTQGKPLLFWETLSNAPLDDLLADAPDAPPWLAEPVGKRLIAPRVTRDPWRRPR